MDEKILFLMLLCIVISGGIVFWNFLRTKKVMDTIDQMLSSAAEGSFSESSFDESQLSSLETRFAHYLSASAVSARNIAAQEERIKTLIADISHQTKTPHCKSAAVQ